MRFDVENETLTLHFHHSHEPNMRRKNGTGPETVLQTNTLIHKGPCVRTGDNTPCVAHGLLGSTRANPKDKISKWAGRKIAITRAVTGASMSESFRKALWVQYLKISPPRAGR